MNTMKRNKLFLPLMILGAGVAAAIVCTLVLGILTEPVITEKTFPFSITYTYNGTTCVIEDSMLCRYDRGDVSVGTQYHYWNGGLVSAADEPEVRDILIEENASGTIGIAVNLEPGVLMGDPARADEAGTAAPTGFCYDPYTGEEFFDEETLAAHGLRITDWDYPEPIENEFVFSGIAAPDGSMSFLMTLIAALCLLVCVIFVKKEDGLVYRGMDNVSVVLNFVLLLTVLPFIAVMGFLSEIVAGGGLTDQIFYCVPAFSFFCLAASVCLRRRGFTKSGFFIQLAGPAVFALALIPDMLRMF